MKIPELRTTKFKLSALPLSLDYGDAVIDDRGKVVAVFFGTLSPVLAEYLTSWTDVMKMAKLQVEAEDLKNANPAEIKPEVEAQSTQEPATP